MTGRAEVANRPAGRVESVCALTSEYGAKTPATLSRHGSTS